MIVGLCLPRSLQLVVGVLGILKAGAAYLPIDPSLPAERMAFMLSDARVPILLTLGNFEIAEAAWSGMQIDLEFMWPTIALCSDQAPIAGVRAEHAAYVIYTSGSTGRPKGVVVTHRGACNMVQAQRQLFGVQRTDRVLQFARLSFDASIWEILLALDAGATLCLMSASEAGGDELSKTLLELDINVAMLTPSALGLLQGCELPRLHTLVVGGESCPLQSARRMSVGRRLINAYGPTEATVFATAGEYQRADDSVSIGRPILNVQIYVLDGRQEMVPIGVVGELCIGGNGLARGYLKQPALTAERFLANPFGAPGTRMYRTGDLVRWLADGRLDFLGRADYQVKIRGFRIELGEIEAVLLRHAAVKQAVVVAREDAGNQKRLVGYVVGAVSVEELREHLKESLPEYMVPSALAVLDELPLTANGKVDRKALPAADVSGQMQGQYVEPRTESERMLAQIWGQVLKLPRVGTQDNFFEVGGHSLLAMQVISRIREIFALELPLRSLFEARTIGAFASHLDEARRKKVGVVLPALVAQQRGSNIPLSFAQERLWFVEQMGLVGAAYHIPMAMRLEGELNAAWLQSSFQELVNRHESLRTRIYREAGRGRQMVGAPGEFNER
jgi:amino acid adenylation domain-containing protein